MIPSRLNVAPGLIGVATDQSQAEGSEIQLCKRETVLGLIQIALHGELVARGEIGIGSKSSMHQIPAIQRRISGRLRRTIFFTLGGENSVVQFPAAGSVPVFCDVAVAAPAAYCDQRP